MKRFDLLKIATGGFCLLLIGAAATASETKLADTDSGEMTTLSQRASYAMGADLATRLKEDVVELDTALFITGMNDALEGRDLRLSRQEMQESIRAFQLEMQDKTQARMEKLAVTNEEEGEAFLAANKEKEGIVTLPSGLQYEVLSEGTGRQPTAADRVSVHYTGKLLDDTVFDSSVERGEPATFPLRGVIPGWTEGLGLMKEGAKWRLFIPPDLAYKTRGAPPKIGPNATLVFDVELLSIVDSPSLGSGPK